MPSNKKPRRKYNPARIQRICNKPRLDSVYHLFQPIYTVFERLENDEIECVNGRAVFKAFDGTWCEVAPAMIGWADCWERIGRNEGIPFDGSYLRIFSQKIEKLFDTESPETITETDIKIAKLVVEQTKHMFMSLPVAATKRHAQTEQIAIELERLNLKEAA